MLCCNFYSEPLTLCFMGIFRRSLRQHTLLCCYGALGVHTYYSKLDFSICIVRQFYSVLDVTPHSFSHFSLFPLILAFEILQGISETAYETVRERVWKHLKCVVFGNDFHSDIIRFRIIYALTVACYVLNNVCILWPPHSAYKLLFVNTVNAAGHFEHIINGWQLVCVENNQEVVTLGISL